MVRLEVLRHPKHNCSPVAAMDRVAATHLDTGGAHHDMRNTRLDGACGSRDRRQNLSG
jgi:hypothetical protein